MLKENDWRLTSQENYLMNAKLHKKSYAQPTLKWDHDHCSFCWAKFMEGNSDEVLHEGYCTKDKNHWICEQCFQDFKDMFHFAVVEG